MTSGRDGSGTCKKVRVPGRVGSGNEKILKAKNHIYRSPHLPAASWKSERVFSAAGNTVTPKRANLNPEKVEECVIVRCNLRLLKLMGLLETSVHVHLFIYSCSKNDEKMILCARVYRNCHSICWITHPRRCFIAFKMKSYYPVPSHFQFSGRDGSGT